MSTPNIAYGTGKDARRIATLEQELEALKKAARDILDGKRSHSLSRRTVTNTSLLKMAALLGDK